MSEDDYLATVERIQQAMAIEPFCPPLIDVLKLLSDWRGLSNQNERLRADLESVVADRDAQVDEVVRLIAIEQAARNLDAHQHEGYATLVSYLIRLHEAL
jgi:hypothetical protein